jgi:hypothetical protein
MAGKQSPYGAVKEMASTRGRAEAAGGCVPGAQKQRAKNTRIAFVPKTPIRVSRRPRPQVHFCTFGWNGSSISRLMALALGRNSGKVTVIGRQYFLRQAATLLKSALSTNDPKLAAALVERADDLLSQIDESGSLPDPSLQAPDVEPDRA